MILSFQMHGSPLVHKASMRYLAEQGEGRFLWPGVGTSFTDGHSVTRPDDMIVANISVLPVNDELKALREGRSAWTVDPDSLQTIGRKVLPLQQNCGIRMLARPAAPDAGNSRHLYCRHDTKMTIAIKHIIGFQ